MAPPQCIRSIKSSAARVAFDRTSYSIVARFTSVFAVVSSRRVGVRVLIVPPPPSSNQPPEPLLRTCVPLRRDPDRNASGSVLCVATITFELNNHIWQGGISGCQVRKSHLQVHAREFGIYWRHYLRLRKLVAELEPGPLRVTGHRVKDFDRVTFNTKVATCYVKLESCRPIYGICLPQPLRN